MDYKSCEREAGEEIINSSISPTNRKGDDFIKNSKISIIVPVYNGEKFLYKCIDSILSQSYKNIEIILVNDGSRDNSLSICKEFGNKDKRIVVIDKENGGVATARNAGLDAATGDYIGFVDSDDYISIDMFEKLLYAIRINDADVVECGHNSVDENYNIVKEKPLKEEVVIGNHECSRNFVRSLNSSFFIWNKLYKSELFDNIRFGNVSFWEDYLSNAKILLSCNKKVVISGCYYYYVNNSDGITRRKFDENLLDILNAGKMVIELYKKEFPDLKIYADLNMLIAIRHLYKRLRASSDNLLKEKHSDYFKKLYKEYYSLVEKKLYEITKTKVDYIAFKLFYYSPDLYCIILNRISKWL